MKIYLDNNATTSLAPEAKEAMDSAYAQGPLNPSSIHSFGQTAKGLLLEARETIASTLGVSDSTLYFTSSATEALSTLIQSFSKGHIITGAFEHAAIYETVRHTPSHTFVSSYEEIENRITPSTSLIVISYANSETGTLFPVEKIATLAAAHNIPLVVDAVAAFGKHPISIHPGISALVISSHKIHGPQGVAATYIRKGLRISPLIRGGGQEKGFRSGTENIPAIVGFAKACTLISPDHFTAMAHLRDHLEHAFPKASILGGPDRVSNVSCIAFPGIDAETLLIQLDQKNIAASHGSACAAGAMQISRALLELGYSRTIASRALRFSLSRYTKKEDINTLIDILRTVLPKG